MQNSFLKIDTSDWPHIALFFFLVSFLLILLAALVIIVIFIILLCLFDFLFSFLSGFLAFFTFLISYFLFHCLAGPPSGCFSFKKFDVNLSFQWVWPLNKDRINCFSTDSDFLYCIHTKHTMNTFGPMNNKNWIIIYWLIHLIYLFSIF